MEGMASGRKAVSDLEKTIAQKLGATARYPACSRRFADPPRAMPQVAAIVCRVACGFQVVGRRLLGMRTPFSFILNLVVTLKIPFRLVSSL